MWSLIRRQDMGAIAHSDDLRSRVVAEILAGASGRQEALTVGAACGLAAGPDHRGTGPDAGSDRAAVVGRSWAEDFGGRHSSVLQATRDHLQKKRCTRPNRIGPTCSWLANAGRPVRQALTPQSWC